MMKRYIRAIDGLEEYVPTPKATKSRHKVEIIQNRALK